MLRRPPRSTLFPTRRSSDLEDHIRVGLRAEHDAGAVRLARGEVDDEHVGIVPGVPAAGHAAEDIGRGDRSEEHTSELQSRLHLVCRLLLEKKKTNMTEVYVV